MTQPFSSSQRSRQAQKVTWIGFFTNLLLTAGKILAGIVGQSAAMISDGIHSLSDFATDIIVICFIGISGKERDRNHPYGHGKYETFATLLIALTLLVVAALIFSSGVEKMMAYMQGAILEQPGMIALWAALASIVAKELLYQYTAVVGRKIQSQTVIANGWHHRSDALSSIGTALGIAGAIFLGEKWRVLDPLAGVIVSLFIIKVGVELALPSIKELLEASLGEEIEKEITTIIMSHNQVKDFHRLKTRKIGNVYAIEMHIKMDASLSLQKAHDVTRDIEVALRGKYGQDTMITVHPEPVQ